MSRMILSLVGFGQVSCGCGHSFSFPVVEKSGQAAGLAWSSLASGDRAVRPGVCCLLEFGLSAKGDATSAARPRPGPSSDTYTGRAYVAAPTRADRSVSAEGSNSMSIGAPAAVSPL